MRTVGVEEELLLVDPRSGRPVPVATAVLRGRDAMGGGVRDRRGVVAELQEEQLEINSHPHLDLAELGRELRDLRCRADQLARLDGARVAALATSPLPVTPTTVRHGRYVRLARLYRAFEEEQLTCGCHVHVGVDSPEEGVAVLDRIRVWLAPLVALAANSPLWQGSDTGYSSYRSQIWSRWPSAGPIDVQGDPTAYRTLVDRMLASGVILDDGMVYFDARLSATYPTVEVRVSDVCMRLGDTVTLAGLVRALVDTAAADWRAGRGAPVASTTLLRAAAWRASRWGLDGDLVNPVDWSLSPAAHVLAGLLRHVGPALRAHGDEDVVAAQLDRLLAEGSGAERQRHVLDGSGSLSAVVRDAVARTHDEPTESGDGQA